MQDNAQTDEQIIEIRSRFFNRYYDPSGIIWHGSKYSGS